MTTRGRRATDSRFRSLPLAKYPRPSPRARVLSRNSAVPVAGCNHPRRQTRPTARPKERRFARGAADANPREVGPIRYRGRTAGRARGVPIEKESRALIHHPGDDRMRKHVPIKAILRLVEQREKSGGIAKLEEERRSPGSTRLAAWLRLRPADRSGQAACRPWPSPTACPEGFHRSGRCHTAPSPRRNPRQITRTAIV